MIHLLKHQHKLRRSHLISKSTSQRQSSGEALDQDFSVLSMIHFHPISLYPRIVCAVSAKVALAIICSHDTKLGVSKPARCPSILYMDAKSGFFFFCCDVLNLIYRQFIKLFVCRHRYKGRFF